MASMLSLRVSLMAGAAFAVAAAGMAFAQDINGVDFSDAQELLAQQGGSALDLSLTEADALVISPMAAPGESPAPVRLELELATGVGDSPVDFAIAQRATLGANSAGDIERRGSGSELRLGHGIVERRDTGAGDSVYMFVASDDEALTWQPGARAHGGAVALQDQVKVGDISAGVTMERNGVQASLAYVEREADTRVGTQSFSQDESFTGVTVTVRR